MILRTSVLVLALLCAACEKQGAVDDDARTPPPLEEMQATPADWSDVDNAVGQRPGVSGLLEKGPIVIDANAMLGPNAIEVRERLKQLAGPLRRDGELLVSVTPPGPKAAYLIIDPLQRALEIGWKTDEGWTVERTAAAEIWHPREVEALLAD